MAQAVEEPVVKVLVRVKLAVLAAHGDHIHREEAERAVAALDLPME